MGQEEMVKWTDLARRFAKTERPEGNEEVAEKRRRSNRFFDKNLKILR